MANTELVFSRGESGGETSKLVLRVNRETRRGRPGLIVLGDPMPEMVKLLPEPSELGA
jgi:hypothetical protein